ncbi:MAG: HD domain-containing protein [Lachnospiraceae bacterium]|nr:HD domain-containing protein [Lachnospiraceae bacterium]
MKILRERRLARLLLLVWSVFVAVIIIWLLYLNINGKLPSVFTLFFSVCSILPIPVMIIFYEKSFKEIEGYIKELKELSEEQKDMVMQTITAIANTIDAKDEYTQGHSHRVAQYSAMLAQELGKSREETDRIYYIALLHDIGKIGIPDSVLHKPGRLTREEYELIKQHPTIGANILKDIKSFPGLDVGAQYHHERYDGKGYPYGKAGDEIPENARIVGVADTFDAMNSNRVYRKHFTKDYIVNELRAGSGTQFDPKVAEAMIRIVESGRLDDVTDSYVPLPGHGSSAEADALITANKMLLDSLVGEHSERYLLEALSNEDTVRRVTDDISEQLKQEQGILMLLELDDMIMVAKQQGYLHMDNCMAIIAEVLVNRDDLLVCRMEGEAFLIYRPGLVNKDEAMRIVDALRLQIKKKISERTEFEGITFSMGVAVSNSNDKLFHKMLSEAEKALYHIKQERRDSYHISESRQKDESKAAQKDLDALVSMLKNKEKTIGTFRFEALDYKRIDELIEHVGDRSTRKLEPVLFTLVANENADVRLSNRQEAIHLLSSAISTIIRPIDIATRFSILQYVVVFLNLADESKTDYIKRIVKEFYNMSPELPFRLSYVSASVEMS